MGSTTGHTTVALRDAAGKLWVTESTVKDDYWPTNGIQRTPFQQWVAQAREAGFNVVHAPLTAEARAAFNATAAWEHFNASEGYDYGTYNTPPTHTHPPTHLTPKRIPQPPLWLARLGRRQELPVPAARLWRGHRVPQVGPAAAGHRPAGPLRAVARRQDL